MSKLLEAYPEGADLDLICEVHGGERLSFHVLYTSLCVRVCVPISVTMRKNTPEKEQYQILGDAQRLEERNYICVCLRALLCALTTWR